MLFWSKNGCADLRKGYKISYIHWGARMSLFTCRKSTEHLVSVMSQYQTQRHGILSFSRKPIGSWVEIHISVDRLVFEQIYKMDRFDIFDVLSLAKEISLHCYFASFDTSTDLYSSREYRLPKDVECLFSTQIPIHGDQSNDLKSHDLKSHDLKSNDPHNIDPNNSNRTSKKCTADKDPNINNAKWAILFQDILDSCETFRGEYGFVIPFVVLNTTKGKAELNTNSTCTKENQNSMKSTVGNKQGKDIQTKDVSHCYYTLNCFNYTAGIWKIRTKALAIATQELNAPQISLSINFSESA